MVANRLAAVLSQEITKGCLPDLGSQPCRLEPRYCPLFAEPVAEETSHSVPEEPIPLPDLQRFRLWISPNQNCDWTRSELFLKQLSRLSRRVCYEISGNREAIQIGLLVHSEDAPVVTNAFRSVFDESEIAPDPPSPASSPE